MTGAVDWSNLTHAGAFIVGAILATVATLRVVRAVATMFEGVEDRRRVRRDGGASSARGGASRREEPSPPDDGTST